MHPCQECDSFTCYSLCLRTLLIQMLTTRGSLIHLYHVVSGCKRCKIFQITKALFLRKSLNQTLHYKKGQFKESSINIIRFGLLLMLDGMNNLHHSPLAIQLTHFCSKNPSIINASVIRGYDYVKGPNWQFRKKANNVKVLGTLEIFTIRKS